MTRRRGIDPMIAMINVVFLLLAFFMLGNFEPPKPAVFTLPVAKTGEGFRNKDVLYVTAGGTLMFRGLQGGDALDAIESNALISADADLDANALIRIVQDLRDADIEILGIEVAP